MNIIVEKKSGRGEGLPDLILYLFQFSDLLPVSLQSSFFLLFK